MFFCSAVPPSDSGTSRRASFSSLLSRRGGRATVRRRGRRIVFDSEPDEDLWASLDFLMDSPPPPYPGNISTMTSP